MLLLRLTPQSEDDVVGYSRLMGTDQVGTLIALKALRREIADPAIAAHNGRIVKMTDDGMLVEFRERRRYRDLRRSRAD